MHLPASCAVKNAFPFEDIRPWLDHTAHVFKPEYPAVLPHVPANPVFNILDRHRLPGRLPADVELIDIPDLYQVLRQNGAMERLPSSTSQLSDEPGFQSVMDCLSCDIPAILLCHATQYRTTPKLAATSL